MDSEVCAPDRLAFRVVVARLLHRLARLGIVLRTRPDPCGTQFERPWEDSEGLPQGRGSIGGHISDRDEVVQEDGQCRLIVGEEIAHFGPSSNAIGEESVKGRVYAAEFGRKWCELPQVSLRFGPLGNLRIEDCAGTVDERGEFVDVLQRGSRDRVGVTDEASQARPEASQTVRGLLEHDRQVLDRYGCSESIKVVEEVRDLDRSACAVEGNRRAVGQERSTRRLRGQFDVLLADG